MEGRTVRTAKTGYTGEPIGYELYVKSGDATWLWNRLVELGARPAGLGARDTLRLEAGMPLYGHEFGVDQEGREMPIFAVSLAKFAVNFVPEKGDFIGRAALERQYEEFQRFAAGDFSKIEYLPRRIHPIALLGRGVLRAGMPVYWEGKQVGYVTSGTMVPYYKTEGEGDQVTLLEETGMRSVGLAYLDSGLPEDARVEIDVRGRRLPGALPKRHLRSNTPPYAIPELCE